MKTLMSLHLIDDAALGSCVARWVSWTRLRLVMLTGYLGARAKRSCLCLWRRSCGSSRGSESRGLSSSREARAPSATASFVRRSCVAACSDPARDNGGLHMPKVAVRPLRSSSYRFPHASPVSTSGAGKQEAAPEDRFKPLISSRKFGAGEGHQTGVHACSPLSTNPSLSRAKSRQSSFPVRPCMP
jgi:hypothetical protein